MDVIGFVLKLVAVVLSLVFIVAVGLCIGFILGGGF